MMSPSEFATRFMAAPLANEIIVVVLSVFVLWFVFRVVRIGVRVTLFGLAMIRQGLQERKRHALR
jgi:hypothetical protein